MRYQKKLNRYEQKEVNRDKVEKSQAGGGLYVYRNNSDADLTLPKPAKNGVRHVGPRKEFEGDNYFMAMVRKNELRLVREIQSPQGVEDMQEKLILDQPATVTTQGAVEHVVPAVPAVVTNAFGKVIKKVVPVVEAEDSDHDVLITEDPLDGVDIITD